MLAITTTSWYSGTKMAATESRGLLGVREPWFPYPMSGLCSTYGALVCTSEIQVAHIGFSGLKEENRMQQQTRLPLSLPLKPELPLSYPLPRNAPMHLSSAVHCPGMPPRHAGRNLPLLGIWPVQWPSPEWHWSLHQHLSCHDCCNMPYGTFVTSIRGPRHCPTIGLGC